MFDFWNQDYLGAWEAGMTLDVAPTSCRVLTLMPSASPLIAAGVTLAVTHQPMERGGVV